MFLVAAVVAFSALVYILASCGAISLAGEPRSTRASKRGVVFSGCTLSFRVTITVRTPVDAVAINPIAFETWVATAFVASWSILASGMCRARTSPAHTLVDV